MIDLHCHSTASDGTLTPEELAEKGRKLALFALTDHDNCEGGARFLAASAALGVTAPRWAGIELSVEPGEGYGRFHLLGLGIDPESPVLQAFLADILAGRNERNVRILARLNELGIPITLTDVARYANGKIVARPHIARVLMERGYASSIKDAFARFLGSGAPAYVSRYRPTQAAAIEVIHKAGGLAVMAHPKYWTIDYAALRTGLFALKDLGLDGVEAYYCANTEGETVDHLRAAAETGLLITAGSDFHGANKPEIPLGMSVPNEAELIARLMERR